MIAIIDYGAGNIGSVEKAFRAIGCECVTTGDGDVILSADKVVLPGVGAFGDAMGKLKDSGLDEVIKTVVSRKTPFLGICLGLQLLFEGSDEAPGVKGLSILPGYVHKFPTDKGFKVPQIGWNDLKTKEDSKLFKGLQSDPYVYFVHSYYLLTEDEYVSAKCDYITEFHAAVEHDNVFACQFHPEKSGDTGLQILKNFAFM